MVDHDGTQHDRTAPDEGGPTDWWEDSDVEIEEFSGIRVAHLPEVDDAWISGWVEVPR
ncbi:hypothetical protein [Haloarcula salinisoli]|uniref:Uncharacterized protein n=1 Tax=Haloarcula salinisoli TaxID=2487746 RepID=A0A8J7YFC1_9EURY|nr:hypothetical protein [Halomicroarcula salinisoli]MBX0286213.1 hypothetical protein [Halomicroarcula salinisoli]MBX0302298.1 hypothetical protein [Halomicroarcula salinisoli]